MKVSLTPDKSEYVIQCAAHELNAVRQLPVRRYDGNSNTWRAAYIIDNYDASRALNIPFGDLPKPTATGYVIDAEKSMLLVKSPLTPANRAKSERIPDYRMWSERFNAWVCRPTRANVEYLLATFDNADITAAAQTLIEPIAAHALETLKARLTKQDAAPRSSDVPELIDAVLAEYDFKTVPMGQQKKALHLSHLKKAFALFMEQGTGKSKVIIDEAAYLFKKGLIDAVLVICPNSVKSNWVEDELPTHLSDSIPREVVLYSSGMSTSERHRLEHLSTTKQPGKLLWLVMNVDAFSHERGVEIAKKFLSRHRAVAVVDESSRIKTPNAKRTRGIVKLGKLAEYRRCLSGTPITQGPMDAYSQFKFLDENILGFSSFYAFRNHYAILGGYNGKQIISYANVEELQRTIDPYSYRVTRDECLDLPPKIYQRLTVDLTAEQRRVYDEMKEHMEVELSGVKATVTLVLTQMLRLQQITGGFFPPDKTGENYEQQTYVEIPGGNPKIDAMLEVCDDVQGKVIVWARFRAEIALIGRKLRERYGAGAVLEFHGGVTENGRTHARQQFQDPASPVRFLVGQTETGGVGLTLTQARTVIYYSNSFSLESRLQSEDRAHRIGQTQSVTYVDLTASKTLDQKLLRALRAKRSLANLITGDNFTEWL